MSNIDQDFVEYVVKSIVGNQDAVSIDRTIDEKGVLLTLTVDPEDLGRVIGKRGATAQSIRTLLRALGTKNDARYNLKIADNGTPKPEREQKAGGNWGDNDKAAKDDDASDDTSSKTDDDEDKADAELDNDVEEVEEKETESVAERTRKELEDLDDLDI